MIDSKTETMNDKQLLALTSLFEDDFSIDWLVELTGCKASQVITVLDEGVTNEYLVHRGSGIYYFSDGDKQKELSDSIGKKEIISFHDRIADLLMRELPENDQKAQIIAYHLLHTKNTIEQCHYLIQAGDNSQKSFKTQHAFQCYAKALEDLTDKKGKDVDRVFTQTAIKYSKYSTARHDTSKVVETLEDALKRAKKIKDRSTQALLEMHIAKNEWLQGNHGNAMTRFDAGWKIANEVQDPKLQRSATTFGTFFLYWQGRFKEAVKSYETYVTDVERYPKGGFPILATITLGYCYSQIGQVTQGLGMIDAVRAVCLEREDLNLASYTAGNMGCIMADMHKYEEAVSHIKLAEKEATEANNSWVRITGYLVQSYCYFHLGEQKKCTRYLKEFLKQRKEVQASVNLYPYLLELLWLIENGKLPAIRNYTLKQELNRTIRSKNIFMKGVAYRFQALLYKKEDESNKKVTYALEQSLKWLKESGHHFQMAETRLEIARNLLKLGKQEEAREAVKKAKVTLSPYTEIKLPNDLLFLVEDQPINEQLFKEILHLGQKVADVVHSKDLLNRVLTSVNRMTGAERCALFLLEESNQQLKFRLRASKNITQAQISNPEFSSSMKMLEKVCETGEGMILESSEMDEGDFFSNQTIKSRICVPMILRNTVIGVLYLDNRLLSSAFKKSDLDLLGYFAAQAAFAIDNAQAYNEIKLLNQRLAQEKEYYKEEHTQNLKSNNIIGASRAIRKVLSQVEQVALTEATALILGPTGVGKELIAREIHNSSARKDKPFIRVHCAALPESLIPSELFGHEKGAFTGATGRRIGRFELADGGTLFLDEIGDIPPDIQVRLLRVLQTREFERVGGTETLQSDFRLITATNKNLEEEVKKNRFRADLFYRLNVFPIHVPNLEERKEDIPLLADYFLKIYSTKMNKPFSKIPEEDMKRLVDYNWPGNVRELENVIERGTILSLGNRFCTPELNVATQSESDYRDDLSLEEVERKHILKILKKTNWKIRGPGGAAEILKIHPSTLHFRIKKLGITKIDR